MCANPSLYIKRIRRSHRNRHQCIRDGTETDQIQIDTADPIENVVLSELLRKPERDLPYNESHSFRSIRKVSQMPTNHQENPIRSVPTVSEAQTD